MLNALMPPEGTKHDQSLTRGPEETRRMELRVGVMGTGSIGRNHIRRITTGSSGAHPVAVSDINVAVARQTAEEHGAKLCQKGEDLIASRDVDAVVVTSTDTFRLRTPYRAAGWVNRCVSSSWPVSGAVEDTPESSQPSPYHRNRSPATTLSAHPVSSPASSKSARCTYPPSRPRQKHRKRS